MAFVIASCTKPPLPTTTTQRKVRFELYTDKDFSSDRDSIFFSVFIQTSGNKLLFDSLLAPMAVKDIPAFSNKIGIDKSLSGYNDSTLKMGFRYSIQDVGNSWFIDSSSAGQSFKLVSFNFR